MHCVNITILKDGVDEVDEYFLVNLVLKYAPFDIPLDTYNATIIDSGEPCTHYYHSRCKVLNCLQLHRNLFIVASRQKTYAANVRMVGNFCEEFIFVYLVHTRESSSNLSIASHGVVHIQLKVASDYFSCTQTFDGGACPQNSLR